MFGGASGPGAPAPGDVGGGAVAVAQVPLSAGEVSGPGAACWEFSGGGSAESLGVAQGPGLSGPGSGVLPGASGPGSVGSGRGLSGPGAGEFS